MAASLCWPSFKWKGMNSTACRFQPLNCLWENNTFMEVIPWNSVVKNPKLWKSSCWSLMIYVYDILIDICMFSNIHIIFIYMIHIHISSKFILMRITSEDSFLQSNPSWPSKNDCLPRNTGRLKRADLWLSFFLIPKEMGKNLRKIPNLLI